MPPVARHKAYFSRSHARGFCCEFQRRQVLVGAKKLNEVDSQTQRVSEEKDKDADLTLNPVELGRRSRQAIEEAWFQVTRLSTPRASFALDDDLGAGIAVADLPPAQAAFTRVLVVGGTGRVGRIVVRKLLLRGYSVRVMCRDFSDEAAQNLPSSAEMIKGDVGNIEDCVKACRGVDKIIYCATSTLQMTADINKVDNIGVSHIARAWLDYKHTSAAKAKGQTKASKRKIADFQKEADQEKWDLLHVGPLDREMGYHGQDIANALITEDTKRLCFQGSIFSRSGICEWGGPCGDLTDCEALVARILGDGKPYLAILEDEEGHTYKYRINTRLGFSTVWMPFNRFRAESTRSPPMRPGMLRNMKFRFDKSLIPADIAREATLEEEQAMRNAFNFEIAYIKAQPQRTEPTLILVSSAASAGQQAASRKATSEMGSFVGSESSVFLGSKEAEGVNARRVSLKRRGEASLRASGVGYCIVRPSALLQEPGGYKALVFDQGDRIQQGIGYADVADVCLRALHASEAVNKTFEVCYENVADDSAMEYELVAHMPDKSNFLKDALDGLERNT